MLDFKIKRLDNIKFDHAELVDYYLILKQNYQHMMWEPPPGEFQDLICSWAIQTKMKNPSLPCNPYHLPGETPTDFNNDFDTPTELIFGFASKILKSFPDVKQTVITVHHPGTTLPWHIDNEEYLEDHYKIHIPIETNSQSYFQYRDEEIVLHPGYAYLVNTSIDHATDNRGITERAHLIFKVPTRCIDLILNTEYIL